MSRSKLITSAHPALTCSSSGIELAVRLQRLSIAQQRFYHASNRRLAGISLHAPPDRPEKTRGLAKPGSGSSKSGSTIRKTAEVGAEKKKNAKKEVSQDIPQRGGLASNSIFSDFIPSSSTPALQDGKATDGTHDFPRNPETISPVLNPRPHARAMWQRKMLIRSLRKRGRLTKDEKILQTERSSLSKSHFFKTSMKKLAPLARQIAGKTIDEAILQMRFSPKKVAQDVRQHLIHARNEAIVARGMGLGSNTTNAEIVTGDTSIVPLSPIHNPTLSLRKGLTPDPTQIYIAQAWVNRGPYGRELEPRAMGRANILRPPHTGLSVLLKEERTRTREKSDKEIRERNKRLGAGHWRQLPDRKVYHQRPFYSW